MREPTAADIHEMVRNPNPDGPVEERYEGGFRLRGGDNRVEGSVDVSSRFGDIDLTVGADSGVACGQVVAGLQPSEARELSLALERAAQAADAARANELRRSA